MTELQTELQMDLAHKAYSEKAAELLKNEAKCVDCNRLLTIDDLQFLQECDCEAFLFSKSTDAMVCEKCGK